MLFGNMDFWISLWKPTFIIIPFNLSNRSEIINTKITTLFPNPVQTELNLNFYTEEDGFYSFNIIDSLGKSIFSKSTFFTKGDNQQKINIEKLARGVFVLQIGNKENVELLRFYKD